MSVSSLREGFLIDSRRREALQMSYSNKGSSVREEIGSVYGENLPVMFHIVYPSEQPSSFTPWEGWRVVQSRLPGLGSEGS